MVPKEGFEFVGLDVLPLKTPASFLKMILAIKSRILLIFYGKKPDAVVGFGNYITLPYIICGENTENTLLSTGAKRDYGNGK